MTEEIKLYFTPKQTVALETLEDPIVQEVMYGGAKGGGKSVFAMQWAYYMCQKLIRMFNIPANPKNVMPVGYMGRKRGVDFTKTTLETWKKQIPPSLYKIRPLDREIIVDNRVKMFYGGMDDESSVNKMNSAEFAFIIIDQAEEISKDDLGLLKGTLRLRKDGIVPDYKVLLTANPAPSFLKSDYIDNPPDDGSKVFIQALPTDNPFLDENYIKTLNDAFKHRPELIRAYVHGSWDDIEGLDILIRNSWVMDSINRETYADEGIRVTSADVARYGHDETVIYNFTDYKLVGENISGMNTVDTNATRIVLSAIQHDSDIIVIDGDGFGGGVVDLVRKMLAKKGQTNRTIVLEINSGRKARDDTKYANAKTEFWFHAADLLAEKKCSIPNDGILITDLTSLKYNTVPNGRFQVETKKDVKKRISRSPDRGDAFVYGLWGHQFVQKKKYDYKRPNQARRFIERGGYGWNKTPAYSGARGYGWA